MFTCSISNLHFKALRICGLNCFEKALNLIFPMLSSQKRVASVAQRFLFPVSTVSATNALGANSPFVSYIRRRKTACRLWALLLMQVRLIRGRQAYTFTSSQNVLRQNKLFLRHVDYALEGFMLQNEDRRLQTKDRRPKTEDPIVRCWETRKG